MTSARREPTRARPVVPTKPSAPASSGGAARSLALRRLLAEQARGRKTSMRMRIMKTIGVRPARAESNSEAASLKACDEPDHRPPSTAPVRLPMPPSTAAVKAKRPSWKPRSKLRVADRRAVETPAGAGERAAERERERDRAVDVDAHHRRRRPGPGRWRASPCPAFVLLTSHESGRQQRDRDERPR